jgi:4-hydroxyphenylpyruvate dioxygenase-like putative hemolysin
LQVTASAFRVTEAQQALAKARSTGSQEAIQQAQLQLQAAELAKRQAQANLQNQQ